MSDTQFDVDPDDGFYVLIGQTISVYEQYETAVNDINEKITTETDSFLAQVAIQSGNDDDDVAITLDQVGWQRIISDMPSVDE